DSPILFSSFLLSSSSSPTDPSGQPLSLNPLSLTWSPAPSPSPAWAFPAAVPSFFPFPLFFSSPSFCRQFPLFLKKPSQRCLLHSKNFINTSKSILSVSPTFCLSLSLIIHSISFI
ncbi:Uncharacterized protein TCM_044375, partial [Theobroma cacao]